MKKVKWSELKSQRLKLTRGISFEEIIQARFIDIRQHPWRSDQEILVFEHKGYYWAVPFITNEDCIFLKTIYPSRKFKKIYSGGKKK